MRKALLRIVPRAGVLGLCVLLCGSCGDVVRQGRGSSYLIIDSLTGASGAKPNDFATTLSSDVITNVKTSSGEMQPTVLQDNGTATLRLAMKDVSLPTDPTTNNEITVESYHVSFTRTDGRNTPGVDVPYGFDMAVTGTVKTGAPIAIGFVLVRVQAKLEPPLMGLRGMGGALVISTIAQVTFYGHDQVGNQVSVTGTISVNFADWGDPT